MQRFRANLATFCLAALLASGCSGAPAGGGTPGAAPAGNRGLVPAAAKQGNPLSAPALIAVDEKTGNLEYWPIDPKGGKAPQQLTSGLQLGYAATAANGNIVVVATESAQVVQYNVSTQAVTTANDPNGVPLDVAVDKNGTIYVLNLTKAGGNVTLFPQGGPPQEVSCSLSGTGSTPEFVAVDNEGDVFVLGYFSKFTGVFEIPNGPGGLEPQKCKRLELLPENGVYVAGLITDPKTDDLIVMDDQDLCAGGREGRMIIYPKPYRGSTGQVHQLGGNCPGGLRMNAGSTVVFYVDSDVSGSYSFVQQRTYPDGNDLGTYRRGAPETVTTIPNSLPN